MKTFLLTTAIATAALISGSETAQADCYGGYGYGGYSYPAYSGHVHHGVNPWINPGYGHYHWHDTSHLHYQPPTVTQHYDHFHVQPGGYYLHQTGHYDLHH